MLACFLIFPELFCCLTLIWTLTHPLSLKKKKNLCCLLATQFWILSLAFLLVWMWSWKMALAGQYWGFRGPNHSSPFRNLHRSPTLNSPATGVGTGSSHFLLMYFPVNAYWLFCNFSVFRQDRYPVVPFAFSHTDGTTFRSCIN